MRKEEYQRIYDIFWNKFEEFEQQIINSSCRFNDIAINLLGCGYFIKTYEKLDRRRKKTLVKYLIGLRDYFNLLEQYSEFRDAELSSNEGGFPELYKIVDTKEGRKEQKLLFGTSPARSVHYVYLCKRRLEDIAKNS